MKTSDNTSAEVVYHSGSGNGENLKVTVAEGYEKGFPVDTTGQQEDGNHHKEDPDHEVLPGTAKNPEDATSYQKRWAELYGRLVAFKEKYGHCRVPNRYEEDPQLGYWVSTQRRQHRLLETATDTDVVPLSAERAKKLEDLGFEWNAVPSSHKSWDGRYDELCEFVEKHGHAQVPMGYEENPRLATWVSTQRQEYKLLKQGRSSRLTEDKKKKLEDIGFVWEAQRGRRKSKQEVSSNKNLVPARKGESTMQKKQPSKSRIPGPVKKKARYTSILDPEGTNNPESRAVQKSGPSENQWSPSGETNAVSQAPSSRARIEDIQSPLDLVAIAAHERILSMQAQQDEESAKSSNAKATGLSANPRDSLQGENTASRQFNASATVDPPGTMLEDCSSSPTRSGISAGLSSSSGLLTSSLLPQGLQDGQRPGEKNERSTKLGHSTLVLGGTQLLNVLGISPSEDQYLANDILLRYLSQQRHLEDTQQARNGCFGVSNSITTPTLIGAAERSALGELAAQHPGLKQALDELEKAQLNVIRELAAIGARSQPTGTEGKPEEEKKMENEDYSSGAGPSSDRKRPANLSTVEPKVKVRLD